MDLVRKELLAANKSMDINKYKGNILTTFDWATLGVLSCALDDKENRSDPSEDRAKLSTLINFVNQEMGNTVEWTGDHWQWKK